MLQIVSGILGLGLLMLLYHIRLLNYKHKKIVDKQTFEFSERLRLKSDYVTKIQQEQIKMELELNRLENEIKRYENIQSTVVVKEVKPKKKAEVKEVKKPMVKKPTVKKETVKKETK